MTNREKLSKMSNEELVNIMKIRCWYCPYKDEPCSKTSCIVATIEWLESEVEEC